MGNVECCENQKNPDFKQTKLENKQPKNLVLKEVALHQSVIKHDKIQKMESKKQTHLPQNLNSLKKETSQKEKVGDRSEVELYRLKYVESRRQLRDLEPPLETKQDKLALTESKVREYEIHERESKQQPTVPQLSTQVRSTLEKNQFFRKQFTFKPRVIAYSSQVYEGQTEFMNNSEIPSGYGKMYKSDGSLYIGEFNKGKAEGKGVYIFTDGSYYQGNFKDNEADDQNGIYKAFNFQYRGGFKNNVFHGKGSEKGEDHQFQGIYNNGAKVSGTLSWEDGAYTYKGPFENEKFHGKGKLIEPTGEYQGYFYEGAKHGVGQYHFTNGLRYEGEYKHNKRQGKGTLYNPNSNVPAYEGEFQDGLPHGQGYIIDENGNRVSTKWVMGIDSASL